MQEPLIDPIVYRGPGACKECGTPLIIAEREIMVMDLNSEGQVVKLEEQASTIKALCPNCGRRQDMMRDPYKGIYRPRSLAAYLFSQMEAEEANKNRIRSINEKDENPLKK